MREIMQFSTTKERLKYLSGGFEEIVPVKVAKEEPEEVKEEKKSPKKASKGRKKAKKVEENGEVQAK